MLSTIPKLLVQSGLVFELAGAFVLACPSLTKSNAERLVLSSLRLPDSAAWILCMLVTLVSVVLWPLILLLGYPRYFIWLISLVLAMSWLPVLGKAVLPGIGEPGRRPTDEERDRIHLLGLSLLVIGFISQGLGSALA